MIRSNRAAPLRVLALVVAAAVAPAIAGCEAGFNAPTQKWHQPAAGASRIVNDELRINNVFVLGAAPAFSLPRGGSAGLFLRHQQRGRPRPAGRGSPPRARPPRSSCRSAASACPPSSRCSCPARPPAWSCAASPAASGAASTSWSSCTSCGPATCPWLVPVMPRAQWFSTFSPAPLLVPPVPDRDRVAVAVRSPVAVPVAVRHRLSRREAPVSRPARTCSRARGP